MNSPASSFWELADNQQAGLVSVEDCDDVIHGSSGEAEEEHKAPEWSRPSSLGFETVYLEERGGGKFERILYSLQVH